MDAPQSLHFFTRGVHDLFHTNCLRWLMYVPSANFLDIELFSLLFHYLADTRTIAANSGPRRKGEQPAHFSPRTSCANVCFTLKPITTNSLRVQTNPFTFFTPSFSIGAPILPQIVQLSFSASFATPHCALNSPSRSFDLFQWILATHSVCSPQHLEEVWAESLWHLCTEDVHFLTSKLTIRASHHGLLRELLRDFQHATNPTMHVVSVHSLGSCMLRLKCLSSSPPLLEPSCPPLAY